MKEKLVEIIQKINPYEEFDDNTDLIEEELLDSLSIVNMVSQIEKELCVEIPLEKMKVVVVKSFCNRKVYFKYF